ncbi:SDR family oxidoreductase, partial [Nocardia nova]|uniref:SDR family oxidoreductase n=1 Tax=Nocardia nova TaxID=37330 RepID=UPI0018953FDC
GREARADILWAEGRLPDLVLACVGGGSNALGLFHPFAADPQVELVAVEAAGRGRADGDHAADQLKFNPLGRYAAPDEVAAMVAFLASPQGRAVNGAILTVDSGT